MLFEYSAQKKSGPGERIQGRQNANSIEIYFEHILAPCGRQCKLRTNSSEIGPLYVPLNLWYLCGVFTPA